jgi:DNA ligase-1
MLVCVHFNVLYCFQDANEAEIKVQVCVFMFDLLYLNGKAFVREPLIKRRTLLRENFREVEGEFKYAVSIDTSTMEEVQVFLEESVKGNFFISIQLH